MKRGDSSSRKLKFIPKSSRRQPPNRPSQPTSGGASTGADEKDADTERLRKSFQERQQGWRRRTENDAPVRVAFGPGAITPASSGAQIVVSDETPPESGTCDLELMEQNAPSSLAGNTVETGSYDEDMKDAFNGSVSDDDVYRVPWEYNRNYPIVHPLREPNSGDPVDLDEAEFGEAARNAPYNEKNINDAKELGLLETSEEKRLLYFQLPPSLPSLKGSFSSTSKGKEVVSSTSKGKEVVGGATAPPRKLCGWEDLPAGQVGKLVVFKSGAVKMKIGEVLFNVTLGSAGESAEDVVAVNEETKKCCRIGKVEKHAVVSADVNSILGDELNEG